MTKLEILVIDDKLENRESAKQLLAEHNVDVASNLVEALTLMGHKVNYESDIEPKKYDVVLTDMMFPMGGRRSQDIVNMSQEGEWQRHEDQPLGYSVVLFAAKQGIAYAAVLTGMNHHTGPISATFDLFYDRDNEHQRQEFTINGTKCIMFDERDHSSIYTLTDGTLTDQSPYRVSEDQRSQYVQEGKHGFKTAKNWKAVLDALNVEK
ncbi:response regulator [Candidatus Woesearchaeota archaeon]|jgi:CheY-like chemotaxis protein|nr:response regulator [Candidatus Woesearchaeota archaeon]